MTDHAARSRALMAAGYRDDAKTEALLAIADAIRGLTASTAGQEDGGDQCKPGGVVLSATEHEQLRQRAAKAEAERDCWQQQAREAEYAQDLLAEERDEWRARAEKAEAALEAARSTADHFAAKRTEAEAERDAVLAEAGVMAAKLNRSIVNIGRDLEGRIEWRGGVREFIDRYAPEG